MANVLKPSTVKALVQVLREGHVAEFQQDGVRIVLAPTAFLTERDRREMRAARREPTEEEVLFLSSENTSVSNG